VSGPTIDRRALLLGTGAAAAAPAIGRTRTARPSAPLAPTPPMGWNSWNSFATTINEAQALETATIMAAKLKPVGYDVFTIDIQWYEPGASSYTYAAKPVPTMDGNGRLLPAPNRFPSSVDGRGFAPIATQVHRLGLKFGIHLMRGIPRLAVERNLPVLGTRYTARDIADTASICPWNPDMYGVDMTRPGAQAYYDSVFRLYASWGVDFVKMDDMSRPYDAHAPEIEAAHRAILATGRPIILSLSPGETPVIRGDHVRRYAQMWRISDDFWDEWPLLEAQFTRLENWNPHRSPGCWPDADMLPLGRLALGQRDTKFTPDEQRTLMTLWSIALAADHGRRPAPSRPGDARPADQSRSDRRQPAVSRQPPALPRRRHAILVGAPSRWRHLSRAVQHRRQSARHIDRPQPARLAWHGARARLLGARRCRDGDGQDRAERAFARRGAATSERR